MSQNFREVAEMIRQKTCTCVSRYSVTRRYHFFQKENVLRDLNMALDELCFMKKASNGSANKTWFREEHKNSSLNFMMLHGSKSLADEKQILRNISIQERYVASIKLLEVLKKTVRWCPCGNHWQKLQGEIEQIQIEWEDAASNTSVKGKIPNYGSLKKDLKAHIKLLCDDYLEDRKQWMGSQTSIRCKRTNKALEAINKVLYSLGEKLKILYDQEDEVKNQIYP